MFISSASRQKYIADEHPLRVRGTPEYNPLYDAFQPNPIVPPRTNQHDFRPITPQPPPRFLSHFHDTESTYDKPRSFGFDNEPKQRGTNGQRQHPTRGQHNGGEKST